MKLEKHWSLEKESETGRKAEKGLFLSEAL